MHRRVYTDTVSCSPQVVWAFLADLRNDKRWRLEVDEVEVLSGNPPFAPATYRESLRWAGLHGQAVLQVTESTPGSRLVIEVNGDGFSSRSSWTFEPGGDGTIITLNFSLEATMVMGMTELVLWGLATGWLSRDLPLLQGHVTCDVPSGWPED